MRRLFALLLLSGCVIPFDVNPVTQAQRERLLAPERVRVPTGFRETWRPAPQSCDDGPGGLAAIVGRSLPARFGPRPVEPPPRADGADGALPGLEPKPEAPANAPSPAALGAALRALDEMRLLPKVELPPATPPRADRGS